MSTLMNKFNLSQIEPISSLPRDYSAFLRRAKARKEPVIFLKRNKPVAALLDWRLFDELMDLKARKEEEQAVEGILQSEKEFKAGKAKLLRSLSALK